jgi:hypothetical protein
VNTLEEWTARVRDEFGLHEPLDRDLVLELAREVAHRVARPAAPLTAFLVGLAAGRAGGSAEAVRSAADRITRLAEEWPAVEQD